MEARDIYKRLIKSTAWIVTPLKPNYALYRHGTGWILDAERRLMVTNHHVIMHGPIEVFFPQHDSSGRLITDPLHYLRNVKPIKAKVIDSDLRRDLALVQLDSIPPGFEAITMASQSAEPGERMHVVGGKPRGSDGLWSYGQGVVRLINQQRIALGGTCRILQSQDGSDKGNSGGAVLNDSGEVIAVVEGGRTEARNVGMNVDVTEVHAWLKEIDGLIDPQTAAAFTTRGRRHVAAKRSDQGIGDFSQAIRMDRDYAAAYVGRAEAFAKKGDNQTALMDFNDAIRIDPANADALIGRGRLHRTLKRSEKALADFSSAIRSQPQSYTAYNERGLTSFFGRKYAEALADFTRAAEISPNNAVLWCNKGHSLKNLGRYSEAVEALDQSVKLSPRYTHAWSLLADCYRSLKKYQDAAAGYMMASKLSPGTAGYLNSLGLVCLEMDKTEAALGAFTKATELSPRYATYHFNRGFANRKLNNYRSAAIDFTRAISLNPKYAKYYYYRALTFKEGGNASAAQVDFAKAAELDPKSYGSAKPSTGDTRVVGSWTWQGKLNDRWCHMSVDLNRDGTFSYVDKVWDGSAWQTYSTESGTYKTTNGRFRMAGKSKNYELPYWFAGGKMHVHFTEYDYNVGFTRN